MQDDEATAAAVTDRPPQDALKGYARLLRPFPVERLDRHLHQVLAVSGEIHDELLKLKTDPPATADEWREAVWRINERLWLLVEVAEDASPRLKFLYDDAARLWDVALDAVVAMWRGVRS